MKKYKSIVLGAFLCVLILSCTSQRKQLRHEAKCLKWGVCKPVKDSLVVRDTLRADTVILDDSEMWLNMLFECDSLNQVKIAELQQKVIGNDINVGFDSNRLVVYVNRPNDTIVRYVREREKAETKTVTVTTNKLTQFQQILFWSGVFFWILFIIFVVVKVRGIFRK